MFKMDLIGKMITGKDLGLVKKIDSETAVPAREKRKQASEEEVDRFFGRMGVKVVEKKL
jgi:hypothetical protein